MEVLYRCDRRCRCPNTRKKPQMSGMHFFFLQKGCFDRKFGPFLSVINLGLNNKKNKNKNKKVQENRLHWINRRKKKSTFAH